MTTASWSTVLDHSSSAGFRAWGSELAAKFAAVGMVQTADTGQINWSTVTIPGTNTSAGFEMWKTASGNLYIKIGYGTGSSAAIPRLSLQVGTGSDGSNNLTGQTSTGVAFGVTGTVIASTTTNYQSYLCATGDYVGLSWKLSSTGSAGLPRAAFVIGPTVDSSGTPTSVGFYALLQGDVNTTAKLQTVRTTATAQTRNATSNYCLLVGFNTTTVNSSDGTNNQAYIHWLDTPAVQPALYSASIIASELTIGNTISLTLVGTTAHTYISASGSNVAHWDAAGVTTPPIGLIMLWE